jgi:hypothetical protein
VHFRMLGIFLGVVRLLVALASDRGLLDTSAGSKPSFRLKDSFRTWFHFNDPPTYDFFLASRSDGRGVFSVVSFLSPTCMSTDCSFSSSRAVHCFTHCTDCMAL